MFALTIFIIVVALIFNYVNGMNDAGNSIATIVTTKVLSPFTAVLWAAFWNFAAAFLFDLQVARTMGEGIVDPSVISPYVILAALLGSILWIYLCVSQGIPNSVSHSLIGGLIGPTLIKAGPSALVFGGILKVTLFIFLSPLLGMLIGYIIMVITLHIVKSTPPSKVDNVSRIMQLVSSAVFSLGHGRNDAQKTMGIIALLLFTQGYLDKFEIPVWVIFASYTTIALGTLTGAWKVIQTLGVGLTHLKPVQGFCAETAGASTLMFASVLGIPVSTTHTITGSIIGVGITRSFSAVRWRLAASIVWAWILTIPASMLVAGLIYFLMTLFIQGA
jgi:PiT family inorganic phosphate transporter